MRKYLETFLAMKDENFMRTHMQKCWELEMPCTTAAKHRSEDYVYQLLIDHGIEAERINLIADGRTVCHDEVAPVCWDASVGRLTVVSDWQGDAVVADYDRHPFHLIQYSTAAPEGGVTTRLVPYERMAAGEDVHGAMVLLSAGQLPIEDALVPILDAGAIGLVNGTATLAIGAEVDEDSLLWANNCTETNCWHVTEGDRPFIGFCVTPRVRAALERQCAQGEVLVKVECDGKRYEGTLPAVTALLRGESEREYWLIAHNGEPLEDDNNSGVITCVNALIQIKKAVEEGKIPPLKYSIRFVSAPELNGQAAMAVRFGGYLCDRCIGAMNADGLPVRPECDGVSIQAAPHPIPFYGNALLLGVWEEYNRMTRQPPYVTQWKDYWHSDSFMSEPSVGLPTVSAYNAITTFWHNSIQRPGYLKYDKVANVAAIYAAHTAMVAAPDPDMLHRFLPLAAANAMRKLAQTAHEPPKRKGADAKAKLAHQLEIQLNDLRSFALAGAEKADIDWACEQVERFAEKLEPIPAEARDTETPVYDALVCYVPRRNCLGTPHDLARLPFRERKQVMDASMMRRVFGSMDGKRDLRDLITEAEFEEGVVWSEKALADFEKLILLLDKYEYIIVEKK